jgi:DnaJ homolog subfamily A member 5
VCNKTFRSEAAWDSHERSKKHIKEVERLKREMQDEEDELGLREAEAELQRDRVADQPEDSASEEDVEEDRNITPTRVSTEPVTATADDFDDEPRRKTKSEKNKRGQVHPVVADDVGIPLPSRKKGKKARRRNDLDLDFEDSGEASSGPTTNLELMEPEISTAAELARPELSKREKRRAKEAEKKAQDEAPKAIVSVFTGIISRS